MERALAPPGTKELWYRLYQSLPCKHHGLAGHRARSAGLEIVILLHSNFRSNYQKLLKLEPASQPANQPASSRGTEGKKNLGKFYQRFARPCAVDLGQGLKICFGKTQIEEQELSLSRSWHKAHSHAYNPPFHLSRLQRICLPAIFELVIRPGPPFVASSGHVMILGTIAYSYPCNTEGPTYHRLPAWVRA
eukprot:g45058.t1